MTVKFIRVRNVYDRSLNYCEKGMGVIVIVEIEWQKATRSCVSLTSTFLCANVEMVVEMHQSFNLLESKLLF